LSFAFAVLVALVCCQAAGAVRVDFRVRADGLERKLRFTGEREIAGLFKDAADTSM